jgi:hypothetical protein
MSTEERTEQTMKPLDDKQIQTRRIQTMEEFRRSTEQIRLALSDRTHTDSTKLIHEDRQR